MTGEAEFEASAERSTIDGRDHGLSQLLQPTHRRLGGFGTGKERRRVIGGEQPLEISAGKERRLTRGEDDTEYLLAFLLDPLHRPAVSVTKRLGHGVDSL